MSNIGDFQVKKKILFVDDEPDFVYEEKIVLEYEGYSVITAGSGRELLKKAREEDPDLIIMDVLLPDINGYEVLKILKKDELCRQIPVILLTALAREKNEELGISAGADFFMGKPHDPKLLMDKIKELAK